MKTSIFQKEAGRTARTRRTFSVLNSAILVLVMALLVSCEEDAVKSDENKITSFVFTSLVPPVAGVIDEAAKTIAASVPAGTDVKALAPAVTVSAKATVAPASGTPVNFTTPMPYLVIAENGDVATYTVTVTVTGGTGQPGASDAKQITSFAFSTLTPPVNAVIDEAAKTITATVPASAVITALTPLITVSANATVSPASGVATNFSQPVPYTVTAANGTTVVYTATITVSAAQPETLPSTISVSRTLPDLGLDVDYIVNSYVTINNNAVVTVEPGVCIAFKTTSGEITVSGGATLKMLGSTQKHIELRGAGATFGTEKGSWEYVDVNTNSDNVFDYVDFINGGSSTGYGVVNIGSSGKLSMTNCKISGSLGLGLYTASGSVIGAFANNIIEGCNKEPVHLGHLSQTAKFDETSTLNNNTDQFVSISASTLNAADLTIRPTTVPYYFTSWIDIEKILTVNPGVTFLMHTSAELEVSNIGCLKFLGTVEKPIKFIGYINSTEKGSWDEIYVNTNNENLFQYVEFENGGKNTGYGVINLSSSGKLSMINCKITGSLGHGVHAASGGTITAFTNNVITDCDHSPAWLGHISQTGAFDATSTLTGNGEEYISISASTLNNANLTTKRTTVPYYFTSWIDIEKLWTIEAGVTFYMHANAEIETSNLGNIVAVGTAQNPIKFTRLPNMGYNWQNINLNSANPSSFTHCIFEYGGMDNDYGVINLGSNTSTTLTNVAINNSPNFGVRLSYSSATVTHSGVTFSNCTKGNVRLANGTASATLP
jgi:hypothetical protein